MSLVAAMEFVGTIGVALWGARTRRNLLALATAVLSAFVAFVFFSMFYLFGEAVISAYRSEPPGTAIAAASGRLWERLPMGAASALAAFGAAALVLRAIGAGVLALAERKARRARRR